MAYLIQKGLQSSSIKSYVSAIKKILVSDKYDWQDNRVLVTSLTRACKLVNDSVKTHLPIGRGLLEMILFEVERHFLKKNQWCLELIYKAMFAVSYYGLMRVGEVMMSPHVVKAYNVLVGTNKDKILIILYSSKTHNEGSRPQKIKITSNQTEKSDNYRARHFCPFQVMRDHLRVRQGYNSVSEPLFVYKDKSPVMAEQARTFLHLMISNIGLESKLYDMHSFRIGRSSDLIKYNYTIGRS